jgi:hypothetical protein
LQSGVVHDSLLLYPLKVAGEAAMPNVKHIVPVLVGVVLTLPGCGLFVPDPHQFYEAKSNDVDFANVIFSNIKCELHKGVQDVVAPEDSPPNPMVQWLTKWGAKVDLKFTTEEDSTLNPGAIFKPPPPFSLSIDLNGMAKATRDEEISFTHAFADLLAEPRIQNCDNENGIQIQSDLHIGEWIFKQVTLATIPGTLAGGMSALDSSNYTLTFVATFSADATPTWTFKHVTVNPNKLINLNRTKTSTLILTLSPVAKTKDALPARLDDQGLVAHNAQVFGQAVGSANQAVSH